MLTALAIYAAALSSLSSAPAQETHPTTPGLTSHEALIDLDIEKSMARAKEALQAAGLILHEPLPQTIGASNEWVFALINCSPLNGKTRVITTAASNPAKRGEAPRISSYLIEYVKTGKPPVAPGVAGVWEWSYNSYIGGGKMRVTLHPDGRASAEGTDWGNTTWWTEENRVMVYWPSPFPKTNLHYVQVMVLAPDGKSMASTASNYYYNSVTALRVGDAPPGAGAPTGGSPTGTTAPPPADQVYNFAPPDLPPAPLPLPAVGAHTRAKTEPNPFPEEPQPTTTVIEFKATHVPDPTAPQTYNGRMQVDVVLSDPGQKVDVDIYIGGYIARLADYEGIPNAGTHPAYAYRSFSYGLYQGQPGGGARRSHIWSIPHVLPAKIRMELYAVDSTGRRTFVSQQETTFDLPWKDYKAVSGGILGDEPAMKVRRFFAMVAAGTETVMFTIPHSHPTDRSNDHGFREKLAAGEIQFSKEMNVDIRAGTQWRAARVDVSPIFQDRDLRNNTYWPRLPRGGYVDGPRIWIGF